MSAARQALERVLEAVRAYLPPDGIDAKEALSRIIAEVDPWPLTSPSAFAALRNDAIARDLGVVLPTGMSPDERLLQKALLEPRTAQPLPLLQRIAGAVWAWL